MVRLSGCVRILGYDILKRKFCTYELTIVSRSYDKVEIIL